MALFTEKQSDTRYKDPTDNGKPPAYNLKY